jgi:hypothetical protein
MTLWFLTGIVPQRRDVKDAGDGLVDLIVCPVDTTPEPVEILSTIDWSYQAAVPRAASLVDELNREQAPELCFPVHLERGWAPPMTNGRRARDAGNRWRTAVERVRNEARFGTISAEATAAIQEVLPGIEFGAPIDAPGKSGFQLMSWNAAALDSTAVPYLERLSSYLATGERPVPHLVKLEREAREFDSQRCHLYLLVASTGRWGNLLPTSPRWFTDGTFTAQEGLTDLWMDGGTGYIMRWRRESGWTYHEQS